MVPYVILQKNPNHSRVSNDYENFLPNLVLHENSTMENKITQLNTRSNDKLIEDNSNAEYIQVNHDNYNSS